MLLQESSDGLPRVPGVEAKREIVWGNGGTDPDRLNTVKYS